MITLDTDIVYFHGQKKNFNTKNLAPSVDRPFYVADNYVEASAYTGVIGPVYPVFLTPGIKTFDMTDPSDIKSLKGKTYYSDVTIDALAERYANQDPDGWNMWRRTHQATWMEHAFKILKQILEQECGSSISLKLLDMKYILVNPIHHYHLKDLENPKIHQYPRVCKDIVGKVAPKTLAQVVDEKFPSSKKQDEYFIALLMADTIQAIAEGKYPYEFMTYRRIIYQAVLDMGCMAVRDTNTTGEQTFEYVLLSPNAIKLILSKPLSPKNREKYSGIDRVMKYFEDNDDSSGLPLSTEKFESILLGGK